PAVIENVIPFTVESSGSPTMTLTGTVALPVADRKSNWPVKLPATNPPPGRLALTTFAVTLEGDVPLCGATFSQLPPSDVIFTNHQFRVPPPPLRSCSPRPAGFPLPGTKEKLS